MVDYYSSGKKIDSLVEVARKPIILETENWRKKVAEFHRGGYDGEAIVRMLDGIIAAKPEEHKKLLAQATREDAYAYQAMQSALRYGTGNRSR
jgi:hypothetical protein